MGYLYEKLKTALGGAKANAGHGTIVNGWTPNGVKAIVITRSSIVVAYHLKPAKITQLDPEEVANDVKRNGSQGALHNLLSQRQLSCLEEFYADGVFQNYKGILDVEGYIARLVNEKSRLRFYGYIDAQDGGLEAQQRYSQAQFNGDFMYAYALDKERKAKIQYQVINNVNWYKNHNLRPQFYSLDNEKGQLHRWFVSCEGKIAKLSQESMEQAEKLGKMLAIKSLVQQDLGNLSTLELFLRFKKYMVSNTDDEVYQVCLNCCDVGLKNLGRVSGLKMEDIKEVVDTGNLQMSPQLVSLLKAYKNIGVYDNKENELKLEILAAMAKENYGFLRVSNLLDNICCDIMSRLEHKNSRYKLLIISAFDSVSDEIPTGKTREKMTKSTNDKGTTLGLLHFIMAICGCTEGFFRACIGGNS